MNNDFTRPPDLEAVIEAGEVASTLTYVKNQKELAAALDFTGAYVSQLKKAGRIHPESDGLWCVENVRQQILDTSDVGQIVAAESRAKNRTNPDYLPAPETKKESDIAPPLDDSVNIEDVYGKDPAKNFIIARSLRERELAAQARFNRMKDEGLTVLKSDVDRAAFTEARQLRDAIFGFLSKAAPLLVSKPDVFEIEQILRDGMQEVLLNCAKKEESTNDF